MGNVCQWIVKPLLGLILALTLVPVLGLPHAVGTGIILVSPQSVTIFSMWFRKGPYAAVEDGPTQCKLTILLHLDSDLTCLEGAVL